MRIKSSRMLIGATGVAGLVAMGIQTGADKGPVAAPQEKPAITHTASRAVVLAPQLPQRREIAEQYGDPFATRSWAAPPPPQTPQPQITNAVAPLPPPNPYRLAGTVVHDGRLQIFVADGNRVFETREGEELDKGYRVESVSRDTVVLIYTPLGTRHTIEVTSVLQMPPRPPERVAALPNAITTLSVRK